VDQPKFPKDSISFQNAWGVADEVLFDNALTSMDKATADGSRAFMHVMTTSNHRPYTYPDGKIDIPSPGGRSGAVKYTDYAIGAFLAEAARKPWFRDTVFLIVADHCASAAGKTELPLPGYRIPGILYAPGIVRPGKINEMVSQLDLAPTMLRILGVPGESYFFGRAIDGGPIADQRAFVSTYELLGYYKNDLLTVLHPKRRVETFRVDPVTFEATPAETSPQLRDEAIAYYQTAAKAFKDGGLKQAWAASK
jgi:phosphoglycerol transferase MdoB-like AlkP superfamily enzyme